MDPLPPQPILLVLILLTVFAVVNTIARTAIVAVSDAWLKQEAEDGNKSAKRLSAFLEGNSAKAIDSLELAETVFAIAISSFSFFLMYGPINEFIRNLFKLSETSFLVHIIGTIVNIFVICFVYAVIVVLVPRRVATKNSEKLSLKMLGYTKFICGVMKPFMGINSFFVRIISRLFGVKEEDMNEEVTEEEIRMLVDIGSESGAIDDDEKQMIHNIFEMDDKPVEEIMTHRTEACILWVEDGIDKWKDFIDETNHTRYPVCGESIDDVVGIVSTRDFYRMLLKGNQDVKSIIREAFFIPDSIKADELFSKMQRENAHMGIVMDEYGGFQGMVTQEDLIEEIVGELYSEYDEPEIEEKEIVQIDETTWEICGSVSIEEVEEALDIKIEEGDYNTFAGLVLNELQAIPADGEVVELETNRMAIKVTSVLEHRIEKATVVVLPKPDEDEEDQEETEKNE